MIERLTSLAIDELSGKTIRGVVVSGDDDCVLFVFDDKTYLFLRAKQNWGDGAEFNIEDPYTSYLLDEMNNGKLAELKVFTPEEIASYHQTSKQEQAAREKETRRSQWMELDKEFGSEQTGSH